MTFREYYKQLRKLERPPHPAKKFIMTIAEITGRSQKTVQQWIVGLQVPNKEIVMLLSEQTGIAPEDLFPELSEDEETINT